MCKVSKVQFRQLNATQLNSTQLNATQLNATQRNSTHLSNGIIMGKKHSNASVDIT
jgi:hypothetical protein